MVDTIEWDEEQILQLARSTQGWDNHPSANEFKDDLEQLVLEAKSKGFCALYDSIEEAEKAVGKKIVLNKLGLIVKERDGKRKARIIWDLKESKVNALCSQGERIVCQMPPRAQTMCSDLAAVHRTLPLTYGMHFTTYLQGKTRHLLLQW